MPAGGGVSVSFPLTPTSEMAELKVCGQDAAAAPLLLLMCSSVPPTAAP